MRNYIITKLNSSVHSFFLSVANVFAHICCATRTLGLYTYIRTCVCVCVCACDLDLAFCCIVCFVSLPALLAIVLYKYPSKLGRANKKPTDFQDRLEKQVDDTRALRAWQKDLWYERRCR